MENEKSENEITKEQKTDRAAAVITRRQDPATA